MSETEDVLLARILRRYILTGEFWNTYGGPNDPLSVVKSGNPELILDGWVPISVEEEELLYRIGMRDLN